MDISVIGTGYVGLTVGACFAAQGHLVTCADVDEGKVASLKHGTVPWHEPDLEELVRRGLGDHRLQFTSHIAAAVRSASMVFVAVGTPPAEDDSVNTQAVFLVADTIGRTMRNRQTVVVKSTVPVGTTQAVRAVIASRTRLPFSVLSNPEFLREGHSVGDFLRPHRVVIGADKESDARPLRDAYLTFVPQERILVVDSRSAEMSKYASNAFLATKVSFINEIANLCEAVGADVELVRGVVGMDPRIGPEHLAPGLGYGGSCFPKDIQSLLHMGKSSGTPMELLESVQRVNSMRPQRLFQQVCDYFGGTVVGKRIAMWGLTFKPDTSDVREAPSLVLVDCFLRAGAHVVAYDPAASVEAMSMLNGHIEYAENPHECVRGADALVVVTQWEHFRSPDWGRMRRTMNTPVIFDGRNLYDPSSVVREGFTYMGVGRGRDLPVITGVGDPYQKAQAR